MSKECEKTWSKETLLKVSLFVYTAQECCYLYKIIISVPRYVLDPKWSCKKGFKCFFKGKYRNSFLVLCIYSESMLKIETEACLMSMTHYDFILWQRFCFWLSKRLLHDGMRRVQKERRKKA